MKALNAFGTASLFAAATLDTELAQSGTVNAAPAPAAAQQTSPATTAKNPDGSDATGKPLEMQSKEGFWGHMNPFARKTWVHRLIDPVADGSDRSHRSDRHGQGDAGGHGYHKRRKTVEQWGTRNGTSSQPGVASERQRRVVECAGAAI